MTTASAVGTPTAVARYRSTPWEAIELAAGLVLMVPQNRRELTKRLANEIWQHYSSVET